MAILNRPFFWNPVAVEIADLTRVGPTIDPVFKTPVNVKIRPKTYLYQAQINLGQKDQEEENRTLAGDRPLVRGHLVMRTLDLAPNSLLPKPQKGWKIVKLYAGTDQELVVDYLLIEVRHESPLQGRPLLVYLPFEDNKDRA